MTNDREETSQQELTTPRITKRLDTTPLVENADGYFMGNWTFRKQLEEDFLRLGFKSRKFSHEKEPVTRLADSLWLTWHRNNQKQAEEAAIDNMEVRVTFAPQESSENPETTIHIACFGRGNRGCLPSRVAKLNVVLTTQDTTNLFHHIQHFMTKPRAN